MIVIWEVKRSIVLSASNIVVGILITWGVIIISFCRWGKKSTIYPQEIAKQVSKIHCISLIFKDFYRKIHWLDYKIDDLVLMC